MGRAAFERRNARVDERIGSESEVPDEPGQVDEVPGAGVLHVARERQRVELLGDLLGDRIDGKSGCLEPEPRDDGIGQVLLEVANDDIGRADVDLEADELCPGQPRDDDEPQAPPGGPCSGADAAATS